MQKTAVKITTVFLDDLQIRAFVHVYAALLDFHCVKNDDQMLIG